MITKKNILENFLNLIFLIILALFFFKSFNYSFYWFEYFQASLKGQVEQIFWDFEVYKCAAELFSNNQNPYNLLTECSPSKKPFIHNYPPLTTFFFIPFVSINFYWSKLLWGFIFLISLVFFTIYQRKLFKSKIHYFPYFLIILFCLDKTIIYSFFTGNLSFILQILLACSFYFLSKNKSNIFFLIIVFISCFKFYFLIFTLCPILLHKFKYLKEIVLTFIFISIFYLFNYLYDPELFANWLLNVYKISIGKNYYDSFGIGSLNYIISLNNFLENNNIFNSSYREYIEVFFTFLYLILITTIGYYYLNINPTKSSKNYKIKTAISIIIVGICIPRLEVYELIVFIIPIIFLFENFYNFKEDKNIYKIFLNFLFISFFLLNGDSGITYPFLIVFIFSTLFLFKKRSKLNI